MTNKDLAVQEKNYTVPALSRGLKILGMFSQKTPILNTNDFAENLGVSTSSIYRIVQTLTDMNFLKKISRNTYQLGPAVISQGYTYLAGKDIIDISITHLQNLRDVTSVSCHLAVREEREVIYIYRALASQRLSVNIPIGTRLPCHSTALGRALLTGLNDSELSQLYYGAQLDNVESHNPQSLPALKLKVRDEREQGYSINQSDLATAIAAPIRDHHNNIIAAINISGPDAFIQGKEISIEITHQLQQTALAISEELGYRVRLPELI
ncbi:IclR family transcriptional regulator [Gammaproteobacteria bacterium AS21]|jgi:DNA-binding IclR family transcriptional regulator